MFGSEYSELLLRRTWTRDDERDYVLGRTVDDHLEIVEIKTGKRCLAQTVQVLMRTCDPGRG
jgi:hypothetical protein